MFYTNRKKKSSPFFWYKAIFVWFSQFIITVVQHDHNHCGETHHQPMGVNRMRWRSAWGKPLIRAQYLRNMWHVPSITYCAWSYLKNISTIIDCHLFTNTYLLHDVIAISLQNKMQVYKLVNSVLCRIKMLPVVGHVPGLRETLRVRAATVNVTLTLMKYTNAYIIWQ